jgi:hypothetical protein
MKHVNCVAFTKQEVVVRATVCLESEKAEEERCHDVSARHRAAQVRGLGGGNREDVPAERPCPVLQIADERLVGHRKANLR